MLSRQAGQHIMQVSYQKKWMAMVACKEITLIFALCKKLNKANPAK
jgi:hypothetical protein